MSDEKRIKVWVQQFKDRPNLVLQWVEPDTGRRKSKSAKTDDPREAEKARADLEYELNHGKYQEASRLTWERFRELFETEYLCDLRPRTQTHYGDVLNLFESLCSPARLRSVNERVVSQFAAGMRTRLVRGRKGMKVSTIKVYLQFLHTALAWAVQQKMLPECPAFPSVKVPKKDPQPIPTESFERLLDKAPDAHMRAYLLTGWLAGLRLSEAAELEWEATETAPYLDLGRNRIVLPAGFVKAGKDQWVPLDPQLRQALEALPRCGPKVFSFVVKKGERTGQPARSNSISGRIIALARKAGVKLTMHSLRKGFGCRYAGKVPAQVLQKLMRHANISTTMDFYANVDAAVEAAVLGEQKPQRNVSRNSRGFQPEPTDGQIDVTTDAEESSPAEICYLAGR